MISKKNKKRKQINKNWFEMIKLVSKKTKNKKKKNYVKLLLLFVYTLHQQ